MPPPLRAAAPLGVGYRPMTDADLPFMADLYAWARQEELDQVAWPEGARETFLAQQFAAQHKHYRDHYPEAEWLVIERAGEAIGRLYIEEWPSQFRLIDIALAPWARRQGVGAAILADVIAMAEAIGKAVSIHVEKYNPARRLYERLGFTIAEDKGVYDLLERRAAG